MRPSRSTPWILAAVLSFAWAGLARAEAPKPSGSKEPEVKLDAPAAKGLRVAVLPVVNSTGELDADKIMEDVLREQFNQVDPGKAVFLLPGDVERILNDENSLDRSDRITARWSKFGSLDSTAVSSLDTLLVADAVMLVKISEWETHRAHNISEGQSTTTIGLRFALYGIRDKKKIWSKEVREQRFAREIDLSSSTVGYDDTGRIQTPNANDPPRVHDVASDLVKDALKKFPTK